MLRTLSLRNVAHLIFKRRRTFVYTAIVPPLLAAAVLLPRKSQYESAASLMVKIIDQDMVAPDALAQQQSQSAASNSNLAKQIVSSEILIITSGGVLKTALNHVGVDRVYPDIRRAAKRARVPLLDLAAERFAKDDLTVRASGESNVLELSVYNADATIARNLLEALITATVSKQASVLRDPRTEFLDRKLESLRKEAETAKRALGEFKRRTQITSFDEERTLLLRQRDDIQLRLSQTRAEYVAAQGRSGALAGALSTTPEEIALSDENDRAQRALDQAQGRLTAARSRYENAKLRYTADNPELADIAAEVQVAQHEVEKMGQQSMARVRKGINPLAQQLSGGLSSARSEANASRGAAKERERQLEDINKRLAYLDSNEIGLRELESRHQVADLSYRSYLQRAESARIVADMNEAGISGLSIVEPPTLPYKPARPRKLMLIALAMIGGMFAGFGVCLLLKILDDTISLPEELEDAIGLPVLASIKLKKHYG